MNQNIKKQQISYFLLILTECLSSELIFVELYSVIGWNWMLSISNQRKFARILVCLPTILNSWYFSSCSVFAILVKIYLQALVCFFFCMMINYIYSYIQQPVCILFKANNYFRNGFEMTSINAYIEWIYNANVAIYNYSFLTDQIGNDNSMLKKVSSLTG